MTQEQKRIKIAEACGWRKVGRGFCGLGGYPPAGYEKHPLPSPDDHPENWRIRDGKSPGNQWFPLPDYFNDLNAMHEAVMSQPIDVRTNFRKELQWMVAPNTKPGRACSAVLMNAEQYDAWFFATAAQRAEAFGRTLNLW